MGSATKLSYKMLTHVIGLMANAGLDVVFGCGSGTALFLLFVLFKLDGKEQGWEHSFLLLSLCVPFMALFKHISIRESAFQKKLEQIREMKNHYGWRTFEYNKLANNLLMAYISMHVGPTASFRNPTKGGEAARGRQPPGNVLTNFTMNGIGAGFAIYVLLFCVFRVLKYTPQDLIISKELIVFCLCTVCAAVFAAVSFTSRAHRKKLDFIESLYRTRLITKPMLLHARQLINGWYTTGPLGFRFNNQAILEVLDTTREGQGSGTGDDEEENLLNDHCES